MAPADPSLIGIADGFRELQQAYRDWASPFDTENSFRRTLLKFGLAPPKRRQEEFDAHSYHWNSIIFPLLKKLHPAGVRELIDDACRYLEVGSLDERFGRWRLLYFIHPGLHELYYYGDHRYDGHKPDRFTPERIDRIREDHRLGLKGLRTYLASGKARAKDGPHVKSCQANLFRSAVSDLTRRPVIGPAGRLDAHGSSRRLLGMLLRRQLLRIEDAAEAKKAVLGWLRYAPCSISEGPIFSLRRGHDYAECLHRIEKLLESGKATQAVLRGMLRKSYFAEVLSNEWP